MKPSDRGPKQEALGSVSPTLKQALLLQFAHLCVLGHPSYEMPASFQYRCHCSFLRRACSRLVWSDSLGREGQCPILKQENFARGSHSVLICCPLVETATMGAKATVKAPACRQPWGEAAGSSGCLVGPPGRSLGLQTASAGPALGSRQQRP